MKTLWIKPLITTSIIMLLSTNIMAENINYVPPTSSIVTKTDSSSILNLINISGKQRMLSQRIAKDYLYIGRKISVSKAKKELDASLNELLAAHKILVDSINNPDIKNLLSFVELSIDDFKSTANEDFNLDNAQLIIDLSESMLEGSQYVVDSLKEKVKVKESTIVGTSGKQRMLAQRIAKYYIAYQTGIKDKNTIDQMKEAVKNFSNAQRELMDNSHNTPAINQKLHQIDKLWKIVYKFYLNIEKGGLPLIVFNTTNEITKKMDDITKLYVELYK